MVKEDPLRSVDVPSLKANADINTTNFMEKSRNMMNFFLQKKLQLMNQKPEYHLTEVRPRLQEITSAVRETGTLNMMWAYLKASLEQLCCDICRVSGGAYDTERHLSL